MIAHLFEARTTFISSLWYVADLPIFLAGAHEHCAITLKEHYLLLLGLLVNFNLPQEVLVFVARIISLHLPQDRLKLPLCTSMYLLSRHFELGQSKSRRVHYCNACHEKLPHFYAQHGEVFPCQCAAARAHTAKTEYMILLDVAEEMRHRLSGTWREWG